MTPELNDQSLLAELKKSKLSPEDKKSLEPLVPQMDRAERERLMELLKESVRVNQKVEGARKRKDEAMAEINQDFLGKIKKTKADIRKSAGKESEGLAQENEKEELKKIEEEMNGIK